jgi:two-component system, NarL family, nitrate/nitrite response regulator NarL
MTLVICDDHDMFVDALRDALECRGHHVAATTLDPAEVSALVTRHRPSLVLLDVQLPGMTGLELAAELRASHGDILIVLLTGSTEERVRQAYQTGLVDGLIAKSTDVRELDNALQRALRGERVLVGWSPAIPAVVRRTSPLERLTRREREVLALIADGETTEAIATRLGVSTNTVRTYVAGVLHKLGVHQRTKAAHAAVELGLLTPG